MEIRQYLLLIRKWLWLLFLGAILGGGAGYALSIQQPKVYETRTRIMIIRAPDEGAAAYSYVEYQFSQSLGQLINAEPVIDLLGEKLGFPVNAGQITYRQETNSSIQTITVRDSDPQRAALIANTLPEVFLLYNEELQKARYATSEQSLDAQIKSVEAQMSQLENEMTQISQETLQSQTQATEARIRELEGQITALNNEITGLRALLPVAPTAIAGETPPPVPALTQAQKTVQASVDAKQAELDTLQSTLDLYRQVYVNLVVFGESRGDSNNQSMRVTQVQTTLALYQQIYSNLVNNFESVRLARLRSTPNVVQVESARVPGSPIRPQPQRDAIMGLLVGMALAAGLAFAVEYMDDTLKSPDDVARAVNLPVIGLIGDMELKKDAEPYVYVAENPRTPIAEAFRTLRTNLEFAGVDNDLKTLLVTSAGPSEGKSTISANLAAVIAQGNKKVALIDADLRRPSMHRYFKIFNRYGLSDLFRSHEDVAAAVTPWGEPPVHVITSGAIPPNPAELLSSTSMLNILDQLKSIYDYVIVDGPPFIVSDPVVLSARVDGVLLVVEPGKTRIGAAQSVVEQLHRAGARVIGVVLNPISRRKASYYSGKYYYFTDYYARDYEYYVSGNGNGTGKRKSSHRAGKSAEKAASD